MIIRALATADQSVHPVVTTTVIIHVREAVQAVVKVAVMVAVRVALAHAKDRAKEHVRVVLVNYCGNCYNSFFL